MAQINREINAETVKLIVDGQGIKEMTLDDAINLAEETDEDVILVSKQGDTPIVRIQSYSKYMYDEKKKQKENAKKQRASNSELKEVRMSCSIGEHDIDIKTKNIDRILAEGDRVKVSIIYKGRTARMVAQGLNVLSGIEGKLVTKHRMDAAPRIDGNRVVMVVAPLK